MKHILLTLHAQTSVHAGMGSVDSVIDVPVQREAHTGYPCIFGSAVKGALRCKAEEQHSPYTDVLFGAGSGADNSNDGNAGALLVSDARLLLLPVRTMTGNFRYVTSPQLLHRFCLDAARFGLTLNMKIPTLGEGQVQMYDEDKALYLEEYRLTRAGSIDEGIIAALAKTMNDPESVDILKKQLAIISNDDFAYLARYTLPVTPHIAINSAGKTAKEGALWYEETLPAETLLYIGIAAADSRGKTQEKAADILEHFTALFRERPWLQIGGNETVGMGWCRTQFIRAEAQS